MPDIDEGFTEADCKDPKKAQAIYKVIQSRLDKCRKDRPIGYLVREAPAEDVHGPCSNSPAMCGRRLHHEVPQDLLLSAEMNDDLEMDAGRYGDAEDSSEYEELLPVSPP